MGKPRTHFEQVPLQIIEKIIEGVRPPEPVNGRDPAASKRKMEKDRRRGKASGDKFPQVFPEGCDYTMVNSYSRNSKRAPKGKSAFNAKTFLDSTGVTRKIKEMKKAEVVYSQGEAAKNVMYLQEGRVKLSVVNGVGKEAVVAILGPGDFFGEGCLAGRSVRMGTATAMTTSTIHVIEKSEMLRLLHEQHDLSDQFIAFMLVRNIRSEEDLIDQLFNSSEKRLARTLLILARYGKEDQIHGVLPPISQETLAEMIGTTRPRVNFFMNKFKKLGFINYDGGLQVNTSLLSVVLHD